MKRLYYLLFVLGLVVLSCNKPPTTPLAQDVVFEATMNSAGLKSACDNPTANFALIKIDETIHQVDVFRLNGTLYTNTLKLSPGNHILKEFVLINDEDSNGDIIVQAIPLKGNAFANFVRNPLPFSFPVAAFIKAEIPIEVLCYEPAEHDSFGFAWFSMDEITVREFCFFGDFCTDNYTEYTGSLYEDQQNGLTHDMPAIFNIDVYRNNNFLLSYNNSEWLGENSTLCVKYPDYSNVVDNFKFVLSILVKEDDAFVYKEFYTWETIDNGNLPNIGTDNVMDFVLGNCVPDADLILPPYGDPIPDPDPVITYHNICFNGDICTDEYADYVGSLYENNKGLSDFMPAIFKIDLNHNGTVSSYNNEGIVNTDSPLCFIYADYPDVVDNYEFTLSILVIDGNQFVYKEFYTWNSTDDQALDNIGTDNLMEFVLGDCVPSEVNLPPYANPNPNPIERSVCFTGDFCTDEFTDYAGSLYENANGLSDLMPAVFKIDINHNGTTTTYNNEALVGVDSPLCINYTDYQNQIDNYIFTLSILVIDGDQFIYKEFYSWTTTDDQPLANIGVNNIMEFVLGDCIPGDLNLPPYINPNPPVDLPTNNSCETAFAFDSSNAACFIEDGFGNWGWTNGTYEIGDYTLQLIAAAGGCDITKGQGVGNVVIDYRSNGIVKVTYNVNVGFELSAVHLYIGTDKYPEKGDDPTVAPGQYTIIDDELTIDELNNYQFNLNDYSGPIYIIAHADVCGNYSSNK